MTTQTHSYRKTAIAVGILYIIATAVSLLSTALTRGALDAPEYLARVSAHGDRTIAAALLLLAGGISVVLIAALLFPVLRRFGEGMALGLVGIRILEAAVLLIDAVGLLLLVSVSRDFVSAGAGSAAASRLSASGALLQAMHGWAFPLDPVVFGIGGLLLYILLYRSRLVPRWLSVWGMAGAALVFIFAVLRMYGGGSLVLALPIGVQEMALAGWLLVKGFDFSASRREALRPHVSGELGISGSRS
jgi:hypothetical protein